MTLKDGKTGMVLRIDSIAESTGAISKISTDVKVTATTKAEQQISLIIKQYIA